MDDYRKPKKRLFSIFEKAKKGNDLNESSHSNVRCLTPHSPDDDPYNFGDIKLISTPQKQKGKLSKSSSLVNQPSSVSNEKLRIIIKKEQDIDHTEIVKDDDDLDDSFVSDSFLDTIDTNAIVDMINTTELIEKESQVQTENVKKCDSNSKENFNSPVSSKYNTENVSCKESSRFRKTKTQSKISKKNKKGVESSTLHSFKTRNSSPVEITLNEKYYSIFRQNEKIGSITTNTDNKQNTQNTGLRQANEENGNQQKTTGKDLNENEVVRDPARKRGRPPSSKSAKVAGKKQPTTRIRKINVAKEPKNTYGRLSEDKSSSVEVRKIPQHFLDEVLDMLQNEDHQVWKDRNISCNAGIHRYWETRSMVSDKNLKLKYARQFLLRREWLNLSKILCLFNRDEKNNTYYPLLVKYATLCLAHTDKEQFQEFVNSLTTINASGAIIKKCTNISPQN